MEVIRNPETEELELKEPLPPDLLANLNFIGKELRKARADQLVSESIYKREARKAAELKLVIEFLEKKVLDVLMTDQFYQDPEIFITVKDYKDFEVTDEALIPEDLIIKRQISQVNKVLVKERLNSSDDKIPGIRRCKKNRVIIK